MKIWGVLFTDRNEMETDHTAYATTEEAQNKGAELARHYWERYQTADGTHEPFPDDCADAWVEMDVFRVRYRMVRLEIDEIEIGDETLSALRSVAQ